MQITVMGRNLDVPKAVKEEAVSRLSRVRKTFDRFLDMDVVFSEETNPRIVDKVHCEVRLHAKGKTLRASAAAPDPLAAISRVEAKLTRQVRKWKTKLVRRPRMATQNGN